MFVFPPQLAVSLLRGGPWHCLAYLHQLWFVTHGEALDTVLLCLSAQSCPTLCNPMDCSPPGFSVHGIFQARMLEWVAVTFSKRSSQIQVLNCVYCIGDGFFTHCVTWEAKYTFIISVCSMVSMCELIIGEIKRII